MADPKWISVIPLDDGCIEAAKWAAASHKPPLEFMRVSKGSITKLAPEMGLIYAVNFTGQGSDKVDHSYQAFVWKKGPSNSMDSMSCQLVDE